MRRQRGRSDAALCAWAESEPRLRLRPDGHAGEGPFRGGEVTVAEGTAADGFHPRPHVNAEWARRGIGRVRSLGKQPTGPTHPESATGDTPNFS